MPARKRTTFRSPLWIKYWIGLLRWGCIASLMGILDIIRYLSPEDQDKTTFTYPYDTFSLKKMPFELCNALATLQRCMLSISAVMVEGFMEVFMDDFSMVGDNFDQCMGHLEKVLHGCVETNVVLNWEN